MTNALLEDQSVIEFSVDLEKVIYSLISIYSIVKEVLGVNTWRIENGSSFFYVDDPVEIISSFILRRPTASQPVACAGNQERRVEICTINYPKNRYSAKGEALIHFGLIGNFPRFVVLKMMADVVSSIAPKFAGARLLEDYLMESELFARYLEIKNTYHLDDNQLRSLIRPLPINSIKYEGESVLTFTVYGVSYFSNPCAKAFSFPNAEDEEMLYLFQKMSDGWLLDARCDSCNLRSDIFKKRLLWIYNRFSQGKILSQYKIDNRPKMARLVDPDKNQRPP